MSGYPEGYQDPEWDGTEAQFRDKVLPARQAAISETLNAGLAGMGFPGLRWEWTAAEEPAVAAALAVPDPEWLEEDRARQVAAIREDILDAFGIPQELRDRWAEIDGTGDLR
jgi:hypothetical protein